MASRDSSGPYLTLLMVAVLAVLAAVGYLIYAGPSPTATLHMASLGIQAPRSLPVPDPPPLPLRRRLS